MSTANLVEENPTRAAVLIVAAALLFAIMGVLVRLASAHLPHEMVVFFRNLAGLVVLLPWLMRRGQLRALGTEQFRFHLFRGLAGLAAMYCFFYALANLPLAEAMLLNYTAPLFTPVIAWLWLREQLTPTLLVAALVGFLGVLLILKPGMSAFEPAMLVGLAAGVFTALAFVGIRKLAATEPSLRIVFYFGLIATIVSALPLTYAWRMPAADTWLLLILMGAVATIAQLMMTRAYAYASAARIGPFTYSIVIFAAVIGWLVWDEVPDLATAAGAALICGAGVVAIRRETKRR